MNLSGIKTMLGFASKARQLVSGETGCRVAMTRKRAKLLILANDAALSTEKEFQLLADRHQVPVVKLMAMDELGMAIGKSNRSVLAVLDKGFAEQILFKMDD